MKKRKQFGGIPKGYRFPNSFNTAVYEAVMALGECSIGQVLAEVGHLIPAAKAATISRARMGQHKKEAIMRGHRYDPHLTTAELVSRGRRLKVTETLRDLYGRGQVERVRIGVYCPIRPRLLQTEAS